ncbi:MAG: response regulator [Thiogranum sp.]|nr:response regulator [Thiogranum sp.]
MPDQKRALVVDDSRSARLVLRRMLEKHDIVVDTVESAASALDFLNHNRPDVIFLDHMMPGMDGFEAIRAIKNNPDTATIPVMMYTSKGGDLYLGQARALGAVGVLPKTVAPVELFESLQRLGLIQERRSADRSGDENGASERAEDVQKRPADAAPRMDPGIPAAPAAPAAAPAGNVPEDRVRKLLEEQRVEIRKDMLLTIETVSRQTGSRYARELDEKLESLQQRTAPRPAESKLSLLVLGALLLVSISWNMLPHRQPDEPARAAAPVNTAEVVKPDSSGMLAELQSRLDATLEQMNSLVHTTDWALNQSLDYPYDEIALDAGRIELIEELLTRLRDSGYNGKIILETHVGEFCLLGSQEQGFSLPPPDLPLDACDFIGNPVQAADTPAAHQSLAFANFLASTPLLENSPYILEIIAGSREAPLHSYPPRAAPATAHEWNRIAEHNNRLIIQLVD